MPLENQGARIVSTPLQTIGYLDTPAVFSYVNAVTLSALSRGGLVSLALVPAVLLGYFLGSVPSAYLLVHWRSRIDIRDAGSGNVGALNSYEVTRSHWVGVTVLVLDLLKGVLAVVAARGVWAEDFVPVAGAALACVAGHNFPVWLRFRGGRGLATAAGAMIPVAWLLVPLWGLLWIAGFLPTRDVNMGNATACVGGLAGMLALPDGLLAPLVDPGIPLGGFRLFAGLLFLLLLTKLADPVRSYIRARKDQA